MATITCTLDTSQTVARVVSETAQPAAATAKLLFSCLAAVASEVEDRGAAAADAERQTVTAAVLARAATDTTIALRSDGVTKEHTSGKSAWVQKLELIASETAAERVARLKAAAAQRSAVSDRLFGLPAECYDENFGSIDAISALNAALDELHARLDACAERLDSTLAGFDTRMLRSLLAASRTPEGGRDGSMFMRSFKPLVDEWSNRRKENERLAKAVSAARPKVDSGTCHARSVVVK